MISPALSLPDRVSHVLLDLDGTLTDSAPGILSSLRLAFAEAGLPVPDDDVLRGLVGPSLGTGLARLGLSHEEASAVIDAYRVVYGAGGMFENALYPGVPGLLACLREAGMRLYVATAKPEFYARQILEHFGLPALLEGGLDGLFGAELEGAGPGAGKGPIIGRAVAAITAAGASSARIVMVGDREHDVEGAAENGLPTVGVRWGYAKPSELEAAGAAVIVDTPEDLLKLLLG